MVQLSKTLPEGYTQSAEINLKAQKKLAVGMNIAAFIVLIPVGILLIWFIRMVHPQIEGTMFSFSLGLESLPKALLLIVILTGMLILHEAIHGIGFWLATREQPKYGLSLAYAYAAAPEWYIPAGIYFWIGIAPLLVIDVVGLLFISVLPVSSAGIIAVAVALNTAGAVGDAYILYRLTLLGKTTLVNDAGDKVLFYTQDNQFNIGG